MLLSFLLHGISQVEKAGRRSRNIRVWQIFLCAFALVMPRPSSTQPIWDKGWNVTANGVPMTVQSFTSQLEPAALVRELVRTHGALSRYLLADGRLLLHGLQEGVHWVAQISRHPKGSEGYVSALYFDSSHMPRLTRADVDHSLNLPMHGLKHRFDFGGSTVVGLAPTQSVGLTAASSLLKEGPWVMASEADPSMAVVVALQDQ